MKNSAFESGDAIRLLFDVKSYGLGYEIPKGDYVFDSFDNYDNTCFIKKNASSMMHYNVSLNVIKKLIILKKLK